MFCRHCIYDNHHPEVQSTWRVRMPSTDNSIRSSRAKCDHFFVIEGTYINSASGPPGMDGHE
jgi:hypothetical protein